MSSRPGGPEIAVMMHAPVSGHSLSRKLELRATNHGTVVVFCYLFFSYLGYNAIEN